MKSHMLKFLAIALSGAFLLAASVPAEARHDRRDHREVRHDHRGGPPGRAVGHHRHAHKHHYRHSSRQVIVHRHHYHPAPKRHYSKPPKRSTHHHYYHSYSRDPAIVVSVPPIVFPLR